MNKRIQIKTSAAFEAAHRLSFYDGKCNRLHGHNWIVDVIIDGDYDTDEDHLLFDFTHVKRIVNQYDHKILLKNNVENQTIFKNFPDGWIVWLNFEPTAENLAYAIKNHIQQEVGIVESIEVKVWENDKSYAVA